MSRQLFRFDVEFDPDATHELDGHRMAVGPIVRQLLVQLDLDLGRFGGAVSLVYDSAGDPGFQPRPTEPVAFTPRPPAIAPSGDEVTAAIRKLFVAFCDEASAFADDEADAIRALFRHAGLDTEQFDLAYATGDGS
jgi:hypothetical protein